MNLFIMGGGYKVGQEVHHLAVSPCGYGVRPYVFSKGFGGMWRLLRGHSHLYRLSNDGRTAEIVCSNVEIRNHVVPVHTLVLNARQADGIQERIKNGFTPEGVYQV